MLAKLPQDRPKGPVPQRRTQIVAEKNFSGGITRYRENLLSHLAPNWGTFWAPRLAEQMSTFGLLL